MPRKILLFLLGVLTVASALRLHCVEKITPPDEIDVDTLLTSPDTLGIGNQRFVLHTDMWRDFMPISPPDGKPLIAIVNIETTDSTAIPSGLDADRLYLIKEDLMWESAFSEEEPPPPDAAPWRLVRVARNGPKWDPGVDVTAVVHLSLGSESLFLKAENQMIYRTD